MLTRTHKNYSIGVSPLRIILFLLIFFFLLLIGVKAQTADKKNLPVWQNYKGVAIGMTIVQVREKLGSAKSEDESGLFYIFSDTENAQFLLDGEKKVRAISTVFSAEHKASPKFVDVFGPAEELQAKPDGSIFKMVKYPEAGCWVSYSRLAGEKAMVIVMIQKL